MYNHSPEKKETKKKYGKEGGGGVILSKKALTELKSIVLAFLKFIGRGLLEDIALT